MNRKNFIWNAEQVAILYRMYPTSSSSDILKSLPFGLNPEQVRTKARYLGIAKLIDTRKKHNIDILLNDSYESFYWLGFLMADGTFSKHQISLTISAKDKDHLLKFMKYISSENTIMKVSGSENTLRVTFCARQVLDVLVPRFKIHTCKTYNPCSLEYLLDKPDYLFCFVIGFIDGDGCLTNTKTNSCLEIVSHKSWVENFIIFFKFLHSYFNIEITSQLPKVHKAIATLPNKQEKKTYYKTRLLIYKTKLIEAIYQKCVEFKIPFMERKLGKFKS